MNPDLLRFVDRVIGTPICFFLSMMNMKKKPKKPKNILLVELIEMGSTIMAYPSIEQIKKDYPDSNIFFLIFKDNKAGVELLDIVKKENIITINHKSIISLVFDTLKYMLFCKKNKIDTVINLELFTRIGTILSHLSGAANNVGFYRYTMEGLYMGNLQTHNVIYNTQMHISRNYLSLVESLKHNDKPLCKQKITSEVKGKQLPAIPDYLPDKEYIVANINSSQLLPQRKWPIENYKKLFKLIIDNTDLNIILSGIQAEYKENEEVCKICPDRIKNMAGKTSLRDFVELCRYAKFVICNDSGPAHFASLTPVKKFVFFGPETPNLYAPLGDTHCFYAGLACSPCVSAYNFRKTTCKDNKCLQAITVEEVFKCIKPYL